MAKVTPSGLIEDISGSVGGVTFSSWKGVTYAKAKAKSVRNPATSAQVKIREGMTFFSRRFFDELTQAQQALWDQFAQEMAGAAKSQSVQGGFGQRVVPQRQWNRSGYNWYIAINVRLVKELGTAHYSAPIDDAPIGQTAPTAPDFTSLIYDPATGKFTVTARGPESLGHATNVTVALWVLPNFAYAREQAQYTVTTGGQVIGPEDLVTIVVQRAALTVPLPDGIYAFQLDAVGWENGLVSPPSMISKIKAKFVGV